MKNQNKRRLSERSHLTIEFPQSDNRVIRTFIPFLENPIVSEKGKANLNSYNLVGRAGQLFSYGGAESRRLNVNFKITLLHVLEEEKDLNEMFKSQFKLFFSESKRAKNAFNMSESAIDIGFDPNEHDADGPIDDRDAAIEAGMRREIADSANNETGVQRNHAKIHRNYYTQLLKNMAGFDPSPEPSYTDTTTKPITPNIRGKNGKLRFPGYPETLSKSAQLAALQENMDALDSTLNLVYLWVNLIRASVLNNSRSTTLGPPIVRLTHGGMYNNVPCLLQDYSIKIVDEAGFDVQTMTPKRLDISLNLIESRTGNFGGYQAGKIELGDNLTGWESVIESNNIDPYNGLIGGEGEYGVEV